MQTVLIIGATGFIGRYIMKHLLAHLHDCRILAVTRSESRLIEVLTQMDRSSLQHSNERGNTPFDRIIPLIGDLDLPNLGLSADHRELALTASVLIHAGGPMDLDMSEKEADRILVHGTRHVCQFMSAMCESNSLRHVIYMGGPLSVGEEARPIKHYERAKLRAEANLRQASDQLGVPLSVVSPGVVIGDARTGAHEQLSSFGLFVSAARRGCAGNMPAGRRGTEWLPLVSVDTVAAYVGALVSEADPRSDTYPLLDPMGQQLQAKQLAQRIARELRVAAPLRSVPQRLIGRFLASPPDKPSPHAAALPDTSATVKLRERHQLPVLHTEELLSSVIADVDYRISHMSGITIRIPKISLDSALGPPNDIQLAQGQIEKPTPLHRYLPGYLRSDLPIIRGQRGRLATWEIAGDSSMPTLVFIHGNFSSSDMLLPIAHFLKNIPMWFLDLPGYGRSPSCDHEDYMEGIHLSVIEALQSSDRPVVLAGHSFGGLIAHKVFERAPELIEHLLLLHPILSPVPRLYKYECLTRLLLRWMAPFFIMKSLPLMEGNRQYHHIPHDLISMIIEELRSPRVRYATAKSLALLSDKQTFQFQINFNAYAERISILWGQHDDTFKLPAEILPHHITRVPFDHYLPITHPIDAAIWIQSRLHRHIKEYT